MFHLYVNIRTPQMTNSAGKQAILLPVQWHARLTWDYPFGVALKTFYNLFLAPLNLAKAQPYTNIFTWWRHATMHAALASTQAHLGRQVFTTQLLPPKVHGTHNGWVQE